MVGIHIFEHGGKSDRIRITVKRKDGSIKSDHYTNEGFIQRWQRRLHLKHFSMTNVGFAQLALLTNGTGGTAFTCIGIGTGTTPAAATDTQLQTPVKIKTATTITEVMTSVAGDTNEWVVTYSNALDGLTGTDLITEIGVFDGTINGTSNMLLHQVYSPSDSVNFDQGDTITVTVTMQNKQG